MTMPKRLVQIRHGQSEANVVQKNIIELDPEVVREIYARPDWMQRLSPLGIEQAKAAGNWIRREIGMLAGFDVIYVSPFLRTFETACYAAGEEVVQLTPEDRIIERDWGLYGQLSRDDQQRLYPDTYRYKKLSPLYARLDGGESIMDAYGRKRDMDGTLHREYPEGRVLMFTHGDTLSTDRYVAERMLPEEYIAMVRDPKFDFRNGSALDRTRTNPRDPEDIREKQYWMRIVHPTCPDLSPYGGEWIEVKGKRTYTVQEGLGRVARTPTLLPDGVLALLRAAEDAKVQEDRKLFVWDN
ncbi:MAG TPA: histidine phosphatase family protein [Candidatus Saccharimonas sp.]|nr:histidine phosphatase family protein [Candidatus Saccharimonas sp.]